MKYFSKILIVITLVALAAPQAQASSGNNKDIVDKAVEAGIFSTLATALTEAGLVDTLKSDGQFTVFAPTDVAFGKLPKGTVEKLLKPENRDQLVEILTYHVVPGKIKAREVFTLDAAETLNGQRLEIKIKDGGVMVDNASVTATDIEASNGVIHVIDTVLLPTSENIVEVAQKAGRFNTLIAAAKSTGLADALTGQGPYTVFAPTDEAFSRLPAGTVDSLLKKENRDKLQMILKYHVVSGRVYSNNVIQRQNVETLAGIRVRISVKSGKAMANGSKIVATDIDAANGVIHVIDGVLLPQEKRASMSLSGADLIEMAINRGAPMYNQGNAEACAAVYEMTAVALLNLDADLPDEARMALSQALSKMRDTHNNVNEQAWIMRHGLDRAYRAMTMKMKMKTQ